MLQKNIESVKRLLLSCCAFSVVTLGMPSCMSLLGRAADKKEDIEKRIAKESEGSFNGGDVAYAVAKGAFNSLPFIGSLTKNVSDEYSKVLDKAIINQQETIEKMDFNMVERNRRFYTPTIQAVSRMIIAKADESQSNIEFVVPSIEKDFLQSDKGKTYGDDMKAALRVLVYHFSTVSGKLSETANRALFTSLTYNYDLCEEMPLISKNDDAIKKKEKISLIAQMVGHSFKTNSLRFNAEQNLKKMKAMKDALQITNG